MDLETSNLKPERPNIITSGEIDVVSFHDGMNPKNFVSYLMNNQTVLVEDYYHNGLNLLKELKNTLKKKHRRNDFKGEREYRGLYRDASHNLMLLVVDHKLEVRKSPKIGWLKKLYPNEEEFLISFPDIQGLNSSWQWYTNGLFIDPLGIKIFPFYGVYFPTRFDHVSLFASWLDKYNGKRNTAIDIGVGSGILSFQLIKSGFKKVVGTDINPNAIISTKKDAERLDMDEQIVLYHCNLFEKIGKKVDMIIFNPPWLQSSHQLKEGIDHAIYYSEALFERFFAESVNFLHDDGLVVLLFSNFGFITKTNDRHPIRWELKHHNRFERVEFLTKEVQSASKKTRRKDFRDQEHVELWVLKRKKK